MIVPMERVRVLAPRGELLALLAALQDAGVVHPVIASAAPLQRLPTTARERRLERQLSGARADADEALAAVGGGPERRPRPDTRPLPLTAAVRLARRERRRTRELVSRRELLLAERELLQRYQPLLQACERLAAASSPEQLRGQLVLLREDTPAGAAAAVERLRRARTEALGPELVLRAQPLAGGQTALLVLAPAALASRLEALLAEARLTDVPLPAGYGGSFLEALPRLRARRRELPRELREVEEGLRRLARERAPELRAVRALLHDRLEELAVLPLLGVTERAAVAEGWAPREGLPRLERALLARLGPRAALERVAREEWRGEEAPVELRNPRLFRPFEALVRPLPLPRYGSLDPTPFVAVFFPMFFGVMVGDLAYGALLALLAALLVRGAPEGSLRGSVGRIAGACAAFTLVFGALYGELLGDLGHRLLGLEPLLFDRAEAVVPFLGLAVALGLVHLLVGLVAGAVAALRGEPRRALGRGVSALMLLLVALAVLAAGGLLPATLLRPAVIALLVAFPVLVAVEGVVAPVELLSTLGHVLSYARIMAIGTASVMLAVVANQMVGTFGSVVVGTLFALLFHLVNFALALFSPAVHALRLHYVELFGTFYSPGGVHYRPLTHWRPDLHAENGVA